MSSLLDRVRLAREGSAVERAHCYPHRDRYSVGHHSLDLVMLITLAWQRDHEGKLPRAELLVAAATHDLAERITGDVPQPIKALLGKELELVDRRVDEWLVGGILELTGEELDYLRQGDKLELWLWCWEQVRRGDSFYRCWINDYSNYWKDNPPPSAYQDIINGVISMGCLSVHQFSFLKEIAGL